MNNKTNITSFRMSDPNREGLESLCKKEKRSRAFLINYAIELLLKQKKAPRDRSQA